MTCGSRYATRSLCRTDGPPCHSAQPILPRTRSRRRLSCFWKCILQEWCSYKFDTCGTSATGRPSISRTALQAMASLSFLHGEVSNVFLGYYSRQCVRHKLDQMLRDVELTLAKCLIKFDKLNTCNCQMCQMYACNRQIWQASPSFWGKIQNATKLNKLIRSPVTPLLSTSLTRG